MCSKLSIWGEYLAMFEVQRVPKNSSCLQMVAAEAKENISLTNKKSSSLLKYSIQSILHFLQYVCLPDILFRPLPLYGMHLSTNVNSTLTKYSVA